MVTDVGTLQSQFYTKSVPILSKNYFLVSVQWQEHSYHKKSIFSHHMVPVEWGWFVASNLQTSVLVTKLWSKHKIANGQTDDADNNIIQHWGHITFHNNKVKTWWKQPHNEYYKVECKNSYQTK